MGHIVGNADCEVRLGLVLVKLVEDSLDHGGGKFLGRQPIASTDDHRVRGGGTLSGGLGLGQRRDNVHVEGFAKCTLLFCPVKHGDGANGRRQGGDETVQREGPEEADLKHTHFAKSMVVRPPPITFFPFLVKVVYCFMNGLGTRTHDDYYALGFRIACIIEQVVAPSGQGGKLVHDLLDVVGADGVKGIARFLHLEKSVRIMGGPTYYRFVGI